MSVWVNVRSGYCPVGRMSGWANIYQASIHGSLSSQVPVQSGYCPVGLLSGRVTVFRVSVHRATACRGCVLQEVSIGLVPGRPTVRIRCKKGVLKNVAIFTGKHLCWSPFADLQGFNFINKRHQQLCFPANIAKL